MRNSIYSTAAGMLTSAERLNIVSNNLANTNTTGFKSDMSFEQTIKFLLEGPYPGKDQPILGGTTVNMNQGVLYTTGNNLDLALQGPGFFSIQGPNNKELYTRNGSFLMNAQKEIVNSEGYPLLDRFNKKITVFGEKVQITPNGEVFIDDNYSTSIKVVNIPDRNDLEKVGNLFFKMKNDKATPAILETPNIVPGALERSNVNLLEGMAEITAAQRSFDLQKNALDMVFRDVRRMITEIPRPV
jgi:flagellar basal body rod protein FlgG